MKTDTMVILDRVFNCSAQQLFIWLVKPELLRRWFGPPQLTVLQVKNDLKVGGHYQIELEKPNKEIFTIEGFYVHIEEPFRLVFTQRYLGLESPPPDSEVEITLENHHAGQSKLRLIQKFQISPSNIENRTKAWKFMLKRLDQCFSQYMRSS